MPRRLLSVILLLTALAGTMAACSHWRCTAQPSLAPGGKQALSVQGFEVRCTKRF